MTPAGGTTWNTDMIQLPLPLRSERDELDEMLTKYAKEVHIEHLRLLCDAAEFWASFSPLSELPLLKLVPHC